MQALIWRLNDLAQLHWRRWDDEWVVFDVGSGQTHQMDTLTAATVMTLEAGPLESAQLTASVAEELLIEAEPSFQHTLSGILDRLSAVGLVEASSR